jgi:tRNA uracil 4-sulfurtransferase
MQKAIALLSGGFDSPVAIHQVQNRVDVIAVHFHQVPLTGDQEIEKVKSLATKLGVKKLYIVPFVEVFKELVDKCRHRDYYVLSKIAMYRAAEEIAEKEGADFLITGENLAQVSSQTLSNMKSISSQISLKIIRPLLTCDKVEIINIAKDIETFEISKGPEVCSLLGPKNPSTTSKVERIKEEINRVDLNSLIKESLKKIEIIERN